MQQVRAKKQLGQHFLKDLSIAQQIADTLHVATPICGNPLRVLEIGPGMGVLTQFLLQQPDYEVTAIEIDHESVDYLLAMKAGARSEEERGKSEEGATEAYWQRLNLIEGDFLRLPIDELYPEGPFCVIGNYPYNISSQIFFKVLEHKDRIPVCAGMIQKEVAERLAAKPGCKAYGILSVLLQAYYDIEYLFTVHEHVFNPPPKVKSAVVRFTRNSRSHLGCDEALFKQVVKTAFNQRRKQMRNSLKGLVESKGESQKTHDLLNDPIFTKRPEQLSVNEFIELTKKISLCLN